MRAEDQAGLLGFERDLAGGDGRREALEFEDADGTERECLAACEQTFDDSAAEDLAGTGAIAEAAGGDDSGAEVVALVAQGVAGVEADADGEVFAVDGATRHLLHGDGTTHGVGGGGEGDHEAVAERLHLGTAMLTHCISQELIVGPEEPLRILVAGAIKQLGGADEVGEEDGGGLGVRGHSASVAPKRTIEGASRVAAPPVRSSRSCRCRRTGAAPLRGGGGRGPHRRHRRGERT